MLYLHSDKLNDLFKNSREEFNKFWPDIQIFIKYGCLRDEKFYEKIKDILIFKNLKGEYVTLKDYLEANKEKHENKVYYANDEKQQSQYIKMFKEYDLDNIVKSAVKKFSSEFIGRKLRLIYDPLNTSVITDEKWLSFVIEQVLSNALKYTPSGSITISLVGEKTLRIEDTGIGIAPSDLPRIFENGYTGFNGRTDKKASGIGLYLCRRVCNNLGHTITANSTVDVGTAIDIDLTQTKLEME